MAHYAYLRVSGTSQVDGDGPERQLETIEKSSGIKFPEESVFFDAAVSGTLELANREGLTKLLSIAKPGDTVWIERPDRLARDLIVNELLIREFRNANIKIVSAEGNIDLTVDDYDDPTATLIRQVLAAFAQFEKTSIVIKLRKARERVRAQKGRCDGRKPYGEKPGEKEILDTILRLHSQGEKPTAIATYLNVHGYKTRKGTAWNPGTIHRIVNRKLQSL